MKSYSPKIPSIALLFLVLTNSLPGFAQEFSWRRISNGTEIPDNAVAGGRDSDGTPLFVARGSQEGNWHPGKTRKDWNTVSIEYGSKELNLSNYEILIADGPLSWEPARQGFIPENSIKGGEENGNILVVCRCQFEGSLQIGKTWAGLNSCNIGYGGVGRSLERYEVLVATPRLPQQWIPVSMGANLPDNALVGGQDSDGSPLFVARGNNEGIWHPGKTRRDWSSANIEYGGKELVLPQYEALVDDGHYSWKKPTNGFVPGQAVVAGQEGTNALCICRCQYSGSVQLGKTWNGHAACNIGYGGKGFEIPDYEVLVHFGR